MFFQQLKRAYERWPVPVSAGANTDLHSGGDSCRTRVRTVSNEWNFVMGALAAAASVTIMIPVDTVKTRLVTQVRSFPSPT